MKVFISWSGTSSRLIAEAFSDWLPKVIQGIDPFVSAKDIDKGANWTVELSRELETAEFGIICLAPDNLLSPWLNYEAGAITRSVDSRVCPVLFGVKKTDVKPPMSQLQLTLLEKEEVHALMASVNKAAGSSLRPEAVREAVEVWWPRLEAAISKVNVPASPDRSKTPAPEPAKPVVDVGEMMEEMLHRIRNLDDRVRRLSNSRVASPAPSARNSAKLRAAREFLTRTFDTAHYEEPAFKMSGNALEVHLARTINDPVPLAVMDAGESVARAEEITVRFISPDRVLVFDPSGSVSDTPF
jgi:hypothetical protein